MDAIETVYLLDQDSRLGPADGRRSVRIVKNEPNDLSPPEKVGEIYRVSESDFKFLCAHCGDELPSFGQFTTHIQAHLMQIHCSFFETKQESIDNDGSVGGFDDNDSVHSAVGKLDSDVAITVKVDTDITTDAICDRSTQRNRKKTSAAPTPAASKLKPFGCPICGKRFAEQRHARVHQSIKHKETIDTHQCDKCLRSFRHAAQLEGHKKRHLNDSSADDQRTFECYHCHQTFNLLSTCYHHLVNHSSLPARQQTVDLECKECHVRFAKKSQWHQHRREVHNIVRNYQRQMKTRLYSCSKCSQQFLDKVSHAAHARQHLKHNPMPYKCHICGRDFLYRCNFTRHLKRHTGNLEKFTCEICHRTLDEVYKSVHMRTHTDERNYQCAQCGLRFVFKAGLQRHMVMHSDDRKFKCDSCPKSYSRSDKLLAHKRTHTGEFIYNCNLCSKGFVEKRSLKKHYFSAHGQPWTDDGAVRGNKKY